MVIANPSEAYAAGAMKVQIEREQVRAASGGLGSVKTGANYAASLLATTRAIEHGYTVALWLDPICSAEHRGTLGNERVRRHRR